jgi:hypothetical protein
MISPLSFEYLAVRFFIKFLAFAPLSGRDDSKTVAAPSETHGNYSAIAAPDAE